MTRPPVPASCAPRPRPTATKRPGTGGGASWLAAALAVTLLSSPALAQDVKPRPEEEIASFRDSILSYYGFTVDASSRIREGARIEVEDWASNSGGGTWDPEHRTVRLRSLQQEAAVRAFAQVWWDSWRKEHPEAPAALQAAVAAMAKGGKGVGRPAAALGRSILKRGLDDRDAFAELAGWTMGRHRTGARALPGPVAAFLDPLFTGTIYRTPYYEGGVP